MAINAEYLEGVSFFLQGMLKLSENKKVEQFKSWHEAGCMRVEEGKAIRGQITNPQEKYSSL